LVSSNPILLRFLLDSSCPNISQTFWSLKCRKTVADFEVLPIRRNILHMDDLLPWLRHYQVQSLNLFPMSGFISIAVEAASQRAALRNALQYDSFQLRSVSVHTPLILMEEDIELTIQLRPQQEGSLHPSDLWDEFRICSWTASKGWAEHCKGLIAAKFNSLGSTEQSTVAEILSAEMVDVDRTTLYDSISNLGVAYGHSFQGISNCQANNICSTAAITTVDTTHEQAYQTESVINPTLLEQLLEMYWPILGAGRESASCKTLYLPSSIEDMTISRKVTDLTRKPGNSLRALCKGPITHSDVVPIQFSMFATAVDSDEVLFVLNDLTVTPIIERDVSSENETPRELCYKLDWEPALQSLDALKHSNLSNGTANGTVNGDSKHVNGVSNGISKVLPNGVFSASNGASDFPIREMVIVHGGSSVQKTLAAEIAGSVEHMTGSRPAICTLTTDIQTSGKLCLFIAELEQNLLSSLTSVQFTSLQKMLTNVEGVLWVTRGAYLSSSNPDANMITGLSRSIRSESLLKLGTLDLDSEQCSSGTVSTILKIFTAIFGSKAEANCELEFAERKGTLFTPRIINDEEMNEAVYKATKSSNLEQTTFSQKDRPLQMTIGAPGALDTLHFVDQLMEDTLPEDEIEVEVKAIGMNSHDVSSVTRSLQTPGFGVECSGVVTRIGSNVTNLSVGSRVACLSISHGVYSTYTKTKAAFAFHIKDDLSFEAAATLPIAYCTAHYGLIDLARLLDGERVLINGVGGTIGQAAICLAKMMGAEVFAMVGSIESKQFLMKRFDLPEDRISFSHISSFGKIAKGGFDVVLNCVSMSSDTTRELWQSLSSFGRFVQVKGANNNAAAALDMTSLQHNRSFMSVNLIPMALERPRVMTRLFSDVSKLVEQGVVQAPRLTVYSISDVAVAFNALKNGVTESKLVISPQPGDLVKVRISRCPCFGE
jgi:NADPH:quinone reductase-like Zn-dependent oxidoreductase